MPTLRLSILKLAQELPKIRKHLIPILKEAEEIEEQKEELCLKDYIEKERLRKDSVKQHKTSSGS